jgi:hypothetical protein
LPAAARAGEDCPAQSFLRLGGLVYASEDVPEGAALEAGAELGTAELDEPTGETEQCRRKRSDVTVTALAGVDHRTAVAVGGESGRVFVLGGRCAGYEGDERWTCITTPLEHAGVPYTGSRYPDGATTLELGEVLGEATIGEESVTVRAIEGVDPGVALGVDGRPAEAFVAPGVCPYERFSADEATDDLARCLRGPVWLSATPVPVHPGEVAVLSGDRAAPAELDGASVALARLETLVDAIPAGADRIPVGTLRVAADGTVRLDATMPDLERGFYEAVVRCEACAARFGATEFPAGTVAVGAAARRGSAGATIAYVALFVVLLLLFLGAIVLWRRGYRPFQRRRPAP